MAKSNDKKRLKLQKHINHLEELLQTALRKKDSAVGEFALTQIQRSLEKAHKELAGL